MYKTIFLETLKGKSLSRTLQNIFLSKIEISGQTMDLGARSKKSSYYRFLKIKPDTIVIFTDLHPTQEGVLKLDLIKKFPVQENSKDFLLLNNVLEHIFEYQTCIDESFKALKPGGKLIGVVPFMRGIHLDPDDYFRYTSSSLKKIFKNSGFTHVEITPLGFGPISTGVSQYAWIARIKLLTAAILMVSIFADKILNKMFKHNDLLKAKNNPLSYSFVCTK
jgi:hypothetical protein